MRRKNTEINVFSVSALDLFASALGVFILLAVIFLPFFPNTGTHPAVEGAVMQRLAKAEAQVADLQAQASTLNAALAAAQAAAAAKDQQIAALQAAVEEARGSTKFPPVDIVVALDSTGSMHAQIAGLKAEVAQFARLMRALSPSFGMGIVEFKDRCEAQPLRAFPLTEMTPASIRQIQGFAGQIMAVSSTCNIDGPEAVGLALQQAIAMPWRSQARKRLIVVITDNPAYPDEAQAVLERAAAFRARGDGYAVSAVHVNSDGSDPAARAFLDALAAAGGGQLVDSGGSFTTTILLALAGV